MPRSTSSLVLTTILLTVMAVNPALAQPDDASDGVVLVHTLAGATAANKINACIQLFAASSDPAGTCDARGLAGGEIGFRLNLNVEGLRLILGSGTYQLLNDGGIRLAADRTVLEGQGDATHLDASLKSGTSAAVDIWNGNGHTVDDATVRDLRVSGVRTGTPGAGFLLLRASNTAGVRLEALTVSDTDRTAIAISDSTDLQVSRCTVFEVTGSGIQVAASSQRVQVFNNSIHRAGLGAAIQSGFGAISVIGSVNNGPAPSWVRVAENTIHDFGGAGIRVTRVAESIPTEIQIVDNQVNGVAPELINTADPRATRDGECITVSGSNIQVLGNRARNAYVNGIAIFLDRANATAENITIAGNTISNSSQMPGGGNVHHAVGMIIKQGLARNIVIVDNVAFDDQLTATQGYGVALNPGTRPAADAVENLYVDGTVSFGGLFRSALDPDALATATTTGNTP